MSDTTKQESKSESQLDEGQSTKKQNDFISDDNLTSNERSYIQSLLKPISENEPVGKDPYIEDSYSAIESEIKSLIRKGEKENSLVDWQKAKKLIEKALMDKQKNLKLASWLLDCHIVLNSFHGAFLGVYIFNEIFDNFWQDFYPKDNTLEKEKDNVPNFIDINDNLIQKIQLLPITEKYSGYEYNFFKYYESRDIAYEKDVINKHQDVLDEAKYKYRMDRINEGKLTPEAFDEAVNLSSLDFYDRIKKDLDLFLLQIDRLDKLIDQHYTNKKDVPGMNDLQKNIETLRMPIITFINNKRAHELSETNQKEQTQSKEQIYQKNMITDPIQSENSAQSIMISQNFQPPVHPMEDPYQVEINLWNEIKADAKEKLKKNDLSYILKELHKRSEYSPSLRIKHQFQLLMAQLCIEAGKKELARPIVFQLNEIIENEKVSTRIIDWEASSWIADVYDTFYKCIDIESEEQLKTDLQIKICKSDVTKLM